MTQGILAVRENDLLAKLLFCVDDNRAKEINRKFQDACRVRIDRIDFMAKGTIPADAKKMLDERKWE